MAASTSSIDHREPCPAQDGSTYLLRPLRPDDARLYPAFDRRMTAEDRRLRFFASRSAVSAEEIRRLTRLDPRSARAVIAVEATTGQMAGVGRVHRLSGGTGEFALAVRSDLRGRGLGRDLMAATVHLGRALGCTALEGAVLAENGRMAALCRGCGFTVTADPGEEHRLLVARIDLRDPTGVSRAA